MTKSVFRVFTVAILVLAFTLPLAAGDVKGNLRITVKDEAGNPMEGVDIHIEYAEQDQERGVFSQDRKTNKRGVLILAGLQPFHYKVVVKKEGYIPVEYSAVKVRLGLTVKVDVELVETAVPVAGSQSQTQAGAAAIELEDHVQRYNEARPLMDLQDWQTAHDIMAETITPREEWPFEFIYAMAICKKNLEEYQDALDLLELVQDEGMGIPMEIQYNKAVVSFKMKNWEKALHYADLVLEIEPEQAGALEIRATSLDKLGRRSEASAAMEKAAEASGDGVALWYRSGVMAFNAMDNEKAIEMMQKVIEVDPTVADAHKILGFSLMRQGKMDEAKPHLQDYLELAPADASDRKMIEGLVSG